jgi:translation initiation factor 2D
MRGCNIECVLLYFAVVCLEANFSPHTVSPLPGKPANAGLEVLVQGKQAKAVMEYLTGRGLPKKWIEVADLTGKK